MEWKNMYESVWSDLLYGCILNLLVLCFIGFRTSGCKMLVPRLDLLSVDGGSIDLESANPTLLKIMKIVAASRYPLRTSKNRILLCTLGV